jgi:hypothetical protein
VSRFSPLMSGSRRRWDRCCQWGSSGESVDGISFAWPGSGSGITASRGTADWIATCPSRDTSPGVATTAGIGRSSEASGEPLEKRPGGGAWQRLPQRGASALICSETIRFPVSKADTEIWEDHMKKIPELLLSLF